MFTLKKDMHNVKYMKILDKSDVNMGDHHPLVMTYKLSLSKNEKTIVNDKQTRIKQPNWLDPFQREMYTKLVEANSAKLEVLIAKHKKAHNAEKKIIATCMFTELTSILIKATERTKNNKIEHKKKNKLGKYRSNKFGWSEQLRTLHKFL